MEKPCLGEPGTSPSALKTCEHDEDGKVEDGTPLRIVQTFCDTTNTEPRLPSSSGSRDLFPLGRNPQHVLPRQGYSRRVETFRRCVVCLELALWKTRAALLGTQSDAGCLCGAGGQPGLCDAGRNCPSSVCQLLQRPYPRSYGVFDAYDSGAGSSTLASLSIPKLSLPVDATGACCLLSVLPDSAKRYHGEPERRVKDAMQSAQVMSPVPEPYFDLVLVHRRRTYLELVRLLAQRSMARFTPEPRQRVGLCAVRKDDS